MVKVYMKFRWPVDKTTTLLAVFFRLACENLEMQKKLHQSSTGKSINVTVSKLSHKRIYYIGPLDDRSNL